MYEFYIHICDIGGFMSWSGLISCNVIRHLFKLSNNGTTDALDNSKMLTVEDEKR